MPKPKNEIVYECPAFEGEAIGLELVFYEFKMRGTDSVSCCARLTEFSQTLDITVTREFCFKTWEDMKNEHPTVESFLEVAGTGDAWTPYNSDMPRALYVESAEGFDGLYKLPKKKAPMVEL